MAEAALEGVVVAGVEDDDVHPVLCVCHTVEHPAQLDGLIAQVALAFRVRINRNQEVLSIHLHAVPGVEEQSNSACTKLLADRTDGALHGS